jgi:hypothetical protein
VNVKKVPKKDISSSMEFRTPTPRMPEKFFANSFWTKLNPKVSGSCNKISRRGIKPFKPNKNKKRKSILAANHLGANLPRDKVSKNNRRTEGNIALPFEFRKFLMENTNDEGKITKANNLENVNNEDLCCNFPSPPNIRKRFYSDCKPLVFLYPPLLHHSTKFIISQHPKLKIDRPMT